MDNENTLDPYDICITVFDSETYYCRCVGYCRHYNQYLTAKQLKRKGCLDHCCSDFIKLEDNIYWKPKEVKEEMQRKIAQKYNRGFDEIAPFVAEQRSGK